MEKSALDHDRYDRGVPEASGEMNRQSGHGTGLCGIIGRFEPIPIDQNRLSPVRQHSSRDRTGAVSIQSVKPEKT